MTLNEKKLQRSFTLRAVVYALFFCIFLGAVIFFLVFIGILLAQSTKNAGGTIRLINDFTCWFDPVFLQYNLILLLVAVLIVPLITFFYVYSMKGEKYRRLHAEIPENKWEECEGEVLLRVESIFQVRNFIGSLSALTMVILLGMGIILLLKPLPESGAGCGVDYSIGANFLMLGPFMAEYIKGEDYTRVITASLTGFQFGFLGAYIYFIGHFVRSYFMLDLTPNTFVVCTVRIISGAVLGLVLSFLLQEILHDQRGVLPVIAFFIGFFPSRGLLFVEKTSLAILKLTPIEYNSTPLAQLPGMSYAHEIRLNREGFDNIENLTEADPLELALRTGFKYGQLKVWVSQAKLAMRLGRDYGDFYAATGIESFISLQEFIEHWPQSGQGGLPCDLLNEATGNKIKGKIQALCSLTAVNGQPPTSSAGERP